MEALYHKPEVGGVTKLLHLHSSILLLFAPYYMSKGLTVFWKVHVKVKVKVQNIRIYFHLVVSCTPLSYLKSFICTLGNVRPHEQPLSSPHGVDVTCFNIIVILLENPTSSFHKWNLL